MPGFYFVGPGGNASNAVFAFAIGAGEKRILQDEDDAAHLGVNGAEDIDAAGFVEGDGFDGGMFVEAEIEFLGIGNRKDVVEDFVVVGPVDGLADENGHDVRGKLGVALGDDFDGFCRRGEIGHRFVDVNDEVFDFVVFDVVSTNLYLRESYCRRHRLPALWASSGLGWALTTP